MSYLYHTKSRKRRRLRVLNTLYFYGTNRKRGGHALFLSDKLQKTSAARPRVLDIFYSYHTKSRKGRRPCYRTVQIENVGTGQPCFISIIQKVENVGSHALFLSYKK